ncbi:MAG: tRNA (adenosine(37)-N6)-threonylcarbamoyltransferase complex dimerization subunit type 1 TsaB [Acidobacteriota bacterium]
MEPTFNSLQILGIDTCGPAGSVALGRVHAGALEVVEQVALEGRTYSATLVAAIGEVLASNGLQLGQIGCIVVVSGPGSFTGVRVGMSAAKGLAEGAGIPVIAVSRLEVLAHASGCTSAALDAHRQEVFLRTEGRELLAGAAELRAMRAPAEVAVCDEAAAGLLAQAWPAAEVLRVDPPDAAGALQLALPRVLAGDYDDVAVLDGHYLRRSDAEIFGPQPA